MSKKEKEGLSANQLVLGAFICLLSYIVLYFLSATRDAIGGQPNFFPIFSIPSLTTSPMFLAMPAMAFFMMFFIIGWINDYFETRHALHPLFPILFLALSLTAYFVALYWYLKNGAILQGVELTFDKVDFWGHLTGSAFILFIWGGIFGWTARYTVEKIKI